MSNEQNQGMPFPLIVGLVIVGIAGYQYLMPKAERVVARVNAGSFAEKYNERKVAALKGDASAKVFLGAANRRLKELRDKADLGENEPRLFLEALKLKGITEADYSK